MTESTLFGVILAIKRWRILILKPTKYKIHNNSSAKVGGKTATYYKQKEKNGSQAGGRGGGGKLRKFRVPIDEQIVMVCSWKGVIAM